jgi:hypothetical protein
VLPATAAAAAAATATAATTAAAAAAAVTTTTAATAAAAVTTTAAATRTLTGLVDGHGAALQLAIVEVLDGLLGAFFGGHFHESETARAAGLPVHHYFDLRDFMTLGAESVAKIDLGNRIRKIPYIEPFSHVTSCSVMDLLMLTEEKRAIRGQGRDLAGRGRRCQGKQNSSGKPIGKAVKDVGPSWISSLGPMMLGQGVEIQLVSREKRKL